MTPEQQQLALDHRNLVHAALKAFGGLRRYTDRDGLIGAGNLGLVQAAARYNPSTGVPFRKYAFIRIRGAILDEMRTESFGTRSTHDHAIAVFHATAEVEQAAGHTPSIDEIAEHLGWPAARVEQAIVDTEQTYLYSLDVFLQDPELDLAAVVPASSDQPDTIYADAETAREVRAAIDRLRPRQRAIVTAYYLHGRSQDDIATEYGVTNTRISQILRDARDRLERTLAGAMHTRFAA
jgi:RNA polymerase sigma factor FliA